MAIPARTAGTVVTATPAKRPPHVRDRQRSPVQLRRSRTTGAVGVALAMTLATEVGLRFLTVDRVSLWWLPAAVVATYVLTDRPSRTLPVVVVGGVVAGSIATGFDPTQVPRTLLSAVTVAGSYGLGAWMFGLLRARADTPLTSSISFLSTMAIAAPLLSGLSTHAVFAAAGLEELEYALRAGTTAAIGDAVAVVALVPLARWLLRRGWRGVLSRASVSVAVVLGAAGAALGATSLAWTVRDEAVLFVVVVPMLVAATVRHQWVVRVVVASTGIGIALGLPATPGVTATGLQIEFVVAAVAASVLSSLVHTRATVATTGHDVIGGVAVPGHGAVLAGVARITRRARLVAVAVLVLQVGVAYAQGWEGGPLPLWVAALGAPTTFLLVNGLSHHLDSTLGWSLRRQRIETLADVAAATVLITVFAPLVTPEQGLLVVFITVVVAAVRLDVREALTTTTAQIALVVVLRAADPLPWTIVPTEVTPAELVAQLVAALLVAWLVAWEGQQLRGSRDQVTLLAGRQGLLNAQLSSTNDELLRANEQLATRSSQLERATADATAAADDERRARGDYERFAAVVAHDLASPLATLRGITSALQRTDYDEETRATLLASALNTATRASALVDRLHEHARAGAAALELEEVDLAELAREVVADQRARLLETSSAVEIDEPMPPVRGDRVLVRQLLANLVGNALRHGVGEDGSAHVHIAAAPAGASVAVTVADLGPGIDPSIADGLFVVGVRGQRSRGLGLGLGTCRTIVERHGGRIGVEPAPAGGTVISFTLPSTVGTTVLLVDAAAGRRAATRTAIELADPSAEVVEAGSVADASSLIAATPAIRAAVVDVALPDGSGLDLVVPLAARSVPVRLIATDVSAADEAAARRLGLTIVDRARLVGDLDPAVLSHPSLLPA